MIIWLKCQEIEWRSACQKKSMDKAGSSHILSKGPLLLLSLTATNERVLACWLSKKPSILSPLTVFGLAIPNNLYSAVVVKENSYLRRWRDGIIMSFVHCYDSVTALVMFVSLTSCMLLALSRVVLVPSFHFPPPPPTWYHPAWACSIPMYKPPLPFMKIRPYSNQSYLQHWNLIQWYYLLYLNYHCMGLHFLLL